MKDIVDLTAQQWLRLIELMRHRPPIHGEAEDIFRKRCSVSIGITTRKIPMNLIDEACDSARTPTWSLVQITKPAAARCPRCNGTPQIDHICPMCMGIETNAAVAADLDQLDGDRQADTIDARPLALDGTTGESNVEDGQ